jgi:hypothetical protein
MCTYLRGHSTLLALLVIAPAREEPTATPRPPGRVRQTDWLGRSAPRDGLLQLDEGEIVDKLGEFVEFVNDDLEARKYVFF